MLSRIPPQVQLGITIALPIVSVLIALLMVVPRVSKLNKDRTDLVKITTENTTQRTLIKAAQLRGPIPPVEARVPSEPNEPVVFLRQLSAVARESGIVLGSITIQPSAPGATEAGAGNASASGSTSSLPPGTTPQSIQASATGSYRSMVAFFAKLESYKRLISVSNVNMSGKGDSLTAQFTITRYTGAARIVSASGG